ncbi:SpoIIIAH-like family protein [Caproiciproducens galactitolivorans]|uniref:SpoIIIAH-like protein n=1 Tax=Caproiciproducens galactitolivorans TaxID=642589 RepID=A0A4Z0YAT7_9FIRM|nr:SpoIIIAH-like family protein [Caproiciproducens galactitolivorans]QEY33956.1 SpoIIIAH-like family protein [Caproiciproducens galactitolivorans]TGJ76080.1 SpoIIIAH-like protein [Caproiciproducens galactitolivorans]
MTMGKRQLVLAALIVALGAAVYLNWQFSGNSPLIATNTVASTAGHELGEAQLADAPMSGNSKSTSSVSQSKKTNASADTYFSEARLSRQKSRDQAVELLEKVLADSKSNDAAKKEAVNQAAMIAQNTLRENNAENLIKAKGFQDCLVFIQNSECSVAVKTNELTQNNAIVIKDIVSGQSGISYDKIKIVEVK